MRVPPARAIAGPTDHRPPEREEAAARPAIEAARGTGAPLRPDQRRAAPDPTDPRLAAVRVHSNAAAATTARHLGALAFTSGTEVFLGDGPARDPTTGPGLLAHELAHALPAASAPGGSNGDPPRVQRATTVPEQVTLETRRYTVWGRGYYYLGRDEIEWHYVTMLPGYGDFDLVVALPPSLPGPVAPKAIAEASVAVLLQAMDVPVRPGGRQALVDELVRQVETLTTRPGWLLRVPVEDRFVRQQFEPADFEKYLQAMSDELSGKGLISPLVAAGSLDGRASGGPQGGKAGGKPAGPPPKPTLPPWAAQKVKQVKALVAKARTGPFPPSDLPDDLAAEAGSREGTFQLRVWAWFGAKRESRTSTSISLGRDDSPEDLLERAREATRAALTRGEERRQAKVVAAAAPAWARTLLKELERKLAEVRRHEPSATDVPDGVTLADAEPAALRIWVERPTSTIAERNSAIVPVDDRSTVTELVPYVRALAAALRQYEQAPGVVPPGVETNFDPTQVQLAAFPARLLPQDLRGDNITVTGARNKFHMALEFERVYGGGYGPITDLAIASKLHRQYIHFYWEVYRVPAGLPLPQGISEPPKEWPRRWAWLNEAVNPPGDEDVAAARARVRSLLRSSQPVTSASGSDLTVQVPIPQEPGDYLVRCHTGHAPIGEHRLKRQSSDAYYPIHVEPAVDVAGEAASARSAAIAMAKTELDAIAETLGGPGLPDNARQALLAQQYFRRAYVERLERRETQTLAGGTSDELAFARSTLAGLDKLAALLPGVLERARAQGVAPSSLISDPELFRLYWFVIAEKKTVEGYQNELRAQVTYLTGLLGRAKEFQGELKADSPYQYAVTGAFVSEVTGHVYPLVFMLGEAPDSYRRSGAGPGAPPVPRTAYTLVDVTDRRTQKVYHGISWQTGPAGHREAIDHAFEDFGEDATYGEGLVAVRIPPGRSGTSDPNHPGTKVRHYASHEGPLQKVLWALGIIAAVAGLAALAATGVGAPAAAAVLGLVAGVAGAITSIHNISERARRHTLEADAELALDIIGIVGVIPAAMGARMTLAARAAGFSRVTRVGRFLQFYGYGEMGATVVLVPVQMADDIYKIENDPDLTPEQKLRLTTEVKMRGLQTGLMMVGSATAARLGAHQHGGGGGAPDEMPGLSRQTELLEREGFGSYSSLKDNGFVDADGRWTSKALTEPVGPVEPPRKLPTPEEPPRKLPTPEEPPRKLPTPEEPPRKLPTPEEPPRKVTPPETPTPAEKAPPRVEEPAPAAKPPAEPETPAKPATEPEQKPAQPPATSSPAETDPGRQRLADRQRELNEQLEVLRRERQEINDLEKTLREAGERRAEVAGRKPTTKEERAAQTRDLREAVAKIKETQEQLQGRASESEVSKQISAREAEASRIAAQLDPKGRAPIPCFSGDTPVLTPGGARPIATLAAGDPVLAQDDGAVVVREVVGVHHNRTRHLITVRTPRGAVRATGRHPFWVEGRGWVAAGELAPGDTLHDVQGEHVVVASVELEEGLDEPSFNLTVAGASTYFVGEGLLVHNQDPVDLGFGGQWIVYRGTNPKYPGDVYIGQTTLYDDKGKPRGTSARQDEHRKSAVDNLAKLDALERQRPLSSKELDQRVFYTFMSEVELAPLVKGIPSKDLADYIEQFNMDFERQNVGGEESLMNRREQISRESHMDEVVDRIGKDPQLGPYCAKK